MKKTPGEILEVVADKGYEKKEDMAECLENGIIPHVIMDDGQDVYELEMPYKDAEADTASTDAEELKKCLHAGKIPDAYQDVIDKISVEEVRRKIETEPGTGTLKGIYGTPEQMKSRAEEGFFVRDPERNLVYCPQGEILRQKSIKKTGTSGIPIRMPVSIVQTGTAAIKEKTSGKKLISQRIVLKNRAEGGRKHQGRKPARKGSRERRATIIKRSK